MANSGQMLAKGGRLRLELGATSPRVGHIRPGPEERGEEGEGNKNGRRAGGEARGQIPLALGGRSKDRRRFPKARSAVWNHQGAFAVGSDSDTGATLRRSVFMRKAGRGPSNPLGRHRPPRKVGAVGADLSPEPEPKWGDPPGPVESRRRWRRCPPESESPGRLCGSAKFPTTLAPAGSGGTRASTSSAPTAQRQPS